MALIQDLFPARAELGTETMTGARVLVLEDRVIVFIEDWQGIHVARDEAISSYRLGPNPEVPTEVTLSSGEVWTAVRSGGCGCSSKLKRMDVQAELAKVGA